MYISSVFDGWGREERENRYTVPGPTAYLPDNIILVNRTKLFLTGIHIFFANFSFFPLLFFTTSPTIMSSFQTKTSGKVEGDV